MVRFMGGRTLVGTLLSVFAMGNASVAVAQVTVSATGAAVYNVAIPVPPGVNGMQPNIGISFDSNASNDILGKGWELNGGSLISRCPGIRDTDGVSIPVAFSSNDKLCLDGRRLIQTNANGIPTAFPQSGDSAGQAPGTFIEYRTELDSFTRIRAYGYATTGASTSGAGWFRVWTKDGRIHDYGASPSSDANSAAIVMGLSPVGQRVAVTWALARTGDVFGNVIDYRYLQRSFTQAGGGPVATSALEWSLAEIQYSGNKIVFSYDDARPDKRESYRLGNKNVRINRLNAITAYTNAANRSVLGVTGSAVAVRTAHFGYETGVQSQRSRLNSVRICSGGPTSASCLPATTFSYADGGSQQFTANANFAASSFATLPLYATAGTHGVLVGDFNGDGRSDLLVWDNDPTKNALYISDGHGSFSQSANFKANGASDFLFNSNGCYETLVTDINGDGLPDLFRYAAPTDTKGKGCVVQQPTAAYLNNGDGSFTVKPVTLPTGINLNRLASQILVPGDALKEGWSSGSTFYVMDVDGDGFPDIVTTIRPYEAPAYPVPTPPSTKCATSVCTHVYKGDGLGGFTTDMSSTSNLLHFDVYSEPDYAYNVASIAHVVDVNNDGFPDILVDSGFWQSNGDWTFKKSSTYSGSCRYSIDFNGDGLTDCLYMPGLEISTGTQFPIATNFNLTPSQLASANLNNSLLIADFDGDGLDDILVATNAPMNNALYLSNGDGTFRPSTSFNLNAQGDQLFDDLKSTATLLGDFTGSGTVEMLRIVDSPVANSNAVNRLYVRSDPTPLDRLKAVTSSSGATTSIAYTLPSSTDGRYKSDFGDPVHAANPSVDKRFDMVPAHFLVKTITSDSGLGSTTVSREFAYFGAKTSTRGRGALGFREMRSQSIAADGLTLLSNSTQYGQAYPYSGLVQSTGIYLTDWARVPGTTPVKLLNNVYCDALSNIPPSGANNGGQNCGRGINNIAQPYLLYSTTSGTDIDVKHTALPVSTTRNVVATNGLVTEIDESVTGLVAGGSQTFSSVTINTPQPDNTACADTVTCNWILARVASTSVTRTVPGVLLPTQAGSATNASATQSVAAATIGSLAFGNVTVGAYSTLTATLSNVGQTPLTLASLNTSSVTGAGFSYVSSNCASTLAPGGSCAINVKFAPNAGIGFGGTLSVATGAGTKLSSLTGTGAAPAVGFQPVSTNWGSIGVASDSGDWPTVVNNSAVPVLLTAHAVANAPPGVYSWQGDGTHCQPGTTVLQPAASCQTFFGTGTLATPGSYSATDQISYQVVGVAGATFTAQQTYAFSMAATTPSATSLDFGHTQPNTTTPSQTVVVHNNAANSPVNIGIAMVGSSPANFPMVNNCGSSLAAGATCTISVAFHPTSFANGITASVQISTTYPRMRGGSVEGYYYAAPASNIALQGGGQGSSLSFSPASYSFGTQATYGTYSTAITVTNAGNVATTGMPSSFLLTGPIGLSGCASELAASASCTLTVTWAPTAAGTVSGTVTNTASSGGSTSPWSWSGTAVTPPLQAFNVQTTSGLSTTFQNPNSYASTVLDSGINVTNAGQANVTTNTCVGSVGAKATCVITFFPLPPECTTDNYNTNSYVTNAAGTAKGSIYKSVSAKQCN